MNLSELKESIDKKDMYSFIVNFAKEFKESFINFDKISLPEEIEIKGKIRRLSSVQNIIIVGMGGSAIGGDIVLSYLYKKIRKPVFLVRNLVLPGFVDESTLLVGVSYSGNTDETLLAFIEGIKRGVYPVIITSDGLLQKMANKIRVPVFDLPEGRPPRTSTAYMLSALLHILEKSDTVTLDRHEILSSISSLSKVLEEYASLSDETLPVQVARKIKGTVPLIYAYKPYTPIGYRFKTQLNENAKYHAFFGELPEVDHNEIMGWEGKLYGKYLPVFLLGKYGERDVKMIIDYWENLLKGENIEYIKIEGAGENLLSDMLYLLVTCDMISYVLALLESRDPTPVGIITKLKEYLLNNTSLRQRVLSEINTL